MERDSHLKGWAWLASAECAEHVHQHVDSYIKKKEGISIELQINFNTCRNAFKFCGKLVSRANMSGNCMQLHAHKRDCKEDISSLNQQSLNKQSLPNNSSLFSESTKWLLYSLNAGYYGWWTVMILQMKTIVKLAVRTLFWFYFLLMDVNMVLDSTCLIVTCL